MARACNDHEKKKRVDMRIGVIGAGSMGGILALHLAKLGHHVSIANSRGPESLTALAAELGTTPRLGPPVKEPKPAGRRDPTNRQLRRLPQSRVPATGREAALARRLMLARLPAPARPQKPRLLEGSQIRSIDGDTFAVGAERFRIRGLDAPETTEAGGFGASQRLDLLLREGPVLVIPYGQDTYGRTLAEVYVNNRNIADVMKEEGHDKQR